MVLFEQPVSVLTTLVKPLLNKVDYELIVWGVWGCVISDMKQHEPKL